MSLLEKTCINPCSNSPQITSPEDIQENLDQLNADWTVTDDGKISRTFTLRNFKRAMALANKIADVAETQGHHPDIHIEGWKFVRAVLFSFSTNTLTENDFIVAAKIDAVQE